MNTTPFNAKEYAKAYYAKNQEKAKAASSQWAKDNAKRKAEYSRQWKAKNQEKVRAYREASKPIMAVYWAKRYQSNKEVFDAKNKQWCKDHPAARSAHIAKYDLAHTKEAAARHQEGRGLLSTLIVQARKRAKGRGQEFNIELCDIDVPEVCPIFKTPFVARTYFAMSLDRVDNSKGYIKGNVKIISRFANIMKNGATYEQCLTFAANIQAYYETTM